MQNDSRSRSKRFWLTARHAFREWNAHEGSRLAASLSLYSVLSLAPLVILAIAIASLVFGHSSAQAALLAEVHALMGADGARAVESILQQGKTPTADRLASVIGILTLLFGASSVFAELQSALNKIWEVKPKVNVGVYGLIKSRLFSFAMVLAIGFLLLVSLVFSAALAALGKYFGELLPAPEWALSALYLVVSFIGVSILISLILKYRSRRADPMARCAGRRHCDGIALHRRKVFARSLSWKGGRGLFLRCGWILNRHSFMGLLFGHDLLLRCRVYSCAGPRAKGTR